MKVGKKTLAVMLACLLVFALMGQLAAAGVG